MNHEARMRLIADWIKPLLLNRYKMPEGLSDQAARDEMLDLAENINRALPSNMNAEAMGVRLQEARIRLSAKHKTRAWPTTREFLDAIGSAAENGTTDDAEAFMLQRCEDWHSKFGEPMPSCVDEGRALALLRRGGCGTAREMYEAGYPLPDSVKRDMGGPTPMAQRRHAQIMESLQAITSLPSPTEAEHGESQR